MQPEIKTKTTIGNERQAEKRTGVVTGLRRLARAALDLVGIREINPEVRSMKELGYAHILEGKSITDDRTFEGKIRRDAVSLEAGRGKTVAEEEVEEIPEAEAVNGTRDFLMQFIKTVESDPNASEEAKLQLENARYMFENLTYISHEDLVEATEGIALYWKNYLDESPENRIMLEYEAYKSSEYIANLVKESLGDDYSDRFDEYIPPMHSLEELEAYLGHTKVVLIDDWVSTGRQISVAYAQRIMVAAPTNGGQDNEQAINLLLAHSELNLIVDTLPRVQNGLEMFFHSAVDGRVLPVKSYWAKKSDDTMLAHFGKDKEVPMVIHNVVTGYHSSTDDALEDPCSAMVAILKDEYGVDATMPPLTNIQRPYRSHIITSPS